jgi:hypothetical protein
MKGAELLINSLRNLCTLLRTFCALLRQGCGVRSSCVNHRLKNDYTDSTDFLKCLEMIADIDGFWFRVQMSG